jgi:ribosome-associated heat shock protein Hsp15
MEKVRIDKWLWSVRIYKTRTAATDACREGKVKIGDVAIKASYQMATGDVVTVRKDGFNFQYRAIQLLEKRVGAPIAVTCYEDVTPQAEKDKYKSWFLNGSPSAERRERGAGRPTKRERRDIDSFKEDTEDGEED